jgi:hypothetical protein
MDGSFKVQYIQTTLLACQERGLVSYSILNKNGRNGEVFQSGEKLECIVETLAKAGN